MKECGEGSKIKILNIYLEKEIDYYENYVNDLENKDIFDVEKLNFVFREIVLKNEIRV